jgi:hypothetical protein
MEPGWQVLPYSKYWGLERWKKVMAIHGTLQQVNGMFQNINYLYTP